MAELNDSIKDGTDWKQKYLQMEAKMSHFHIQALDIRNKLADKIAELTVECEKATKRAVTAEDEVSLLKEKLNRNNNSSRIRELEECLQEQKDLLAESEARLQLEIQQRNQEREAVHKKTQKLKEWIADKLQEVETQKKELFEANKRATTSLYEMKMKVQELSMELALSKQTGSNLELDATSSISPVSSQYKMDISPPVPDHGPRTRYIREDTAASTPSFQTSQESSSWSPRKILLHSDQESNVLVNDSSSASTMETVTPISSVDSGLHKRDAVVLAVSPAKDYRSKYDDDTSHQSAIFKSDSMRSKVDDYKKKKKSATLPMTRSKKQPSNQHHSSLIETFGNITRKFRGFTESHHHQQITPSSSRVRRTQSAGKKESKVHRDQATGLLRNNSKHKSTSSIVTRKDSLKSSQSGSSKHSAAFWTVASPLHEEEEKSSENMEISDSNSGFPTNFSSSMPSSVLSSTLPRAGHTNTSIHRSTSLKMNARMQPPTPPAHMVPLWETRIYNLTKTGFELRLNDVNRNRSVQDCSALIHHHSPKEKTSRIYEKTKMDIPVLTKIGGKIIQISETSFKNVSDASDDEESGNCQEVTHSCNNVSSSPAPALQSYPVIQHRRNGSPGSVRAIKRANSTQSVTSSEGDYSIPPDAQSACSDSSEPEHKLLKTGHTGKPTAPRVHSSSSISPESVSASCVPTASSSQPLEKCGYLLKLSGKTFTWKKRWFVLKLGKLQYYISSNDMTKNPLGEVVLDDSTVFSRTSSDECHKSIFQISLKNRNIYLSAPSSHAADEWIRALHMALNRPRRLSLRKAGHCHSIGQEKIPMKGWLERSLKEGKRKKLWACIGNSMLYFFKDEKEEVFSGRLHLRDCKVSPLQSEGLEIVSLKFPSSSGQQRDDVHLFFSSKLEKDAWLYRLHVASGSLSLPSTGVDGTEASIGTLYERMVARLMYAALCSSDNTDESISVAASSPLWRNPVLAFSREPLVKPLTTLSSEALQTEAVKLIKSCQLFMNVRLESASVDYHVTLVQRIATACLTHSQLQDEIYAQLIKATNRKLVKYNTSPTHSVEKFSTPSTTDEETAILQMWKILSLLIPVFLPHQRMLWFLQAHLHRHADGKTEVGQYVMYCLRALERATVCGSRTSPPSKTETISILLQNPYHHSLPFSVPVHLLSGKYEVVSFDASSCVDEFTRYVCERAGVRETMYSGFALFTDDPVDSNAEHRLSGSSKICDVLSEWERSYRENSTSKTVEATGRIKLTFCQYLSLTASQKAEMEKEKVLLVYQISMEIAQDRFPLSRDLAIELTALCAQMHDSDYQPATCDIKQILKKFHPNKYLENANKQHLRHLREKVCERWSSLRDCTALECARVFLNSVRKCSLYGSKLFKAKLEISTKHKTTTIWLAVHENGFYELNYLTMAVERSYSYRDIVTFGGCDERVMFVVEQANGFSQKLFYSLLKAKGAEMISLVAEYSKLFVSTMSSD